MCLDMYLYKSICKQNRIFCTVLILNFFFYKKWYNCQSINQSKTMKQRFVRNYRSSYGLKLRKTYTFSSHITFKIKILRYFSRSFLIQNSIKYILIKLYRPVGTIFGPYEFFYEAFLYIGVAGYSRQLIIDRYSNVSLSCFNPV